MCRFIAGKPALLAALKTKNWDRVAYYYNGSNYRVNKYDEKLATAYAKWQPRFA
jgi:hypothetical protein